MIEGANLAARAAVGHVGRRCGFAAVGGVAVAIGKARPARWNACCGPCSVSAAARAAMIIGARCAAGSTICSRRF